MFSLAGVTTNAGIAKTFNQVNNSYQQEKYPVIEPVQTRGVFELKETLIIDNIVTDLGNWGKKWLQKLMVNLKLKVIELKVN